MEQPRGSTRPLAVAAVATLLGLGALAATVMHPHAAPAATLTDTTPAPQPPPPTTTPTPTPTPDPAPAPTPPPPKPTPKPPPVLAPTPTIPAATPTPQPVTQQPRVRTTPRVAPTTSLRVRPKPHRAVRHAKPKPRVVELPVRHLLRPTPSRGRAVAMLPVIASTARANAAFVAAPVAAVQPGTSFHPLRPLIIVALCLSFAALGVAAAPARVMPWRRASYFLHERHLEFTMVGLALLATAAFAILLTKA